MKRQSDQWSHYYRYMIWGPVIAGFMLPFLVTSLFDSDMLDDLAIEPVEFAIMVFYSLFYDMPFLIVARLTQLDRQSNIPIKRGLTNLAVRFLPLFMIYAFLLYSVTRTAELGLPGASTAPIAILLFQPIAVVLVLILNWMLKQASVNKG